MLTAIHAANTIDDVDAVPGWKLHPLKGDLKGYWSLTVTPNQRLIFRFMDGDAYDLDLTDYH
jgi:proteic killer suppression protein